ncbi:MAG: hypothetical protein KTR28_08720 [Micavibrio sp.]|nr:hypothetical protein [Micavibrio sp.]
MPEIIVMSVIGTIYLRFQIKDLKSRAEKISHISRVLEKEVLGLMGLVFSVLALFFVTGFIGYCVIVVVKNLGAHGWIEWAAAIIGGVYIAVLIGLYMLLKERQSALFDHGKNSFQGVLMVLAAGLLLFIVPLLMYQAAYNPKTYEKLHPTPPVNRI